MRCRLASKRWRPSSERLGATIADPEFYRQPADAIKAALARTQEIEHELLDLYARWDTLDSFKSGG